MTYVIGKCQFVETLIECWMAKDNSLGERPVEEAKDDGRPSGEKHIEQGDGPVLENGETGESGEKGEPKFNYVQANVLVEANREGTGSLEVEKK